MFSTEESVYSFAVKETLWPEMFKAEEVHMQKSKYVHVYF